MDAPGYILAVFFMAAIGVAAAVGALVMTLRHMTRESNPRIDLRNLTFDFPIEPRPARALLYEPEPEAEADPEPEAEPEPPLPLSPRLTLSLVSPGSPDRLRIPVNLTSGRILELSLPLHLSAEGGCDLEGVKVTIAVPNEITYVASLERMIRQPLGPLGASAGYSFVAGQTVIEINLTHLAGGTVVQIPIPVCVKRAPGAAYVLAISADCEGLARIERKYDLELVVETEGEACELVQTEEGVRWICRPDEGRRQRDPRLPLDRIDRFMIVGDTIQPAEVLVAASMSV